MQKTFTWDPRKNDLNLKKHGIDFETAIEVWEDPDAYDGIDDAHSEAEERFHIFGYLHSLGKVYRVVYTEPDEQTIRVITAYTNPQIERLYYEQND